MGSASVIGDERSGWAAGEGVEEHADRQCEQPLDDPLGESGGCFGEVAVEPHLAFEVGDGRLDHESQAGEASLSGEVVGVSSAVGGEDGDVLEGERLGVGASPEAFVGQQRAAGVGGRSSRTGCTPSRWRRPACSRRAHRWRR